MCLSLSNRVSFHMQMRDFLWSSVPLQALLFGSADLLKRMSQSLKGLFKDGNEKRERERATVTRGKARELSQRKGKEGSKEQLETSQSDLHLILLPVI